MATITELRLEKGWSQTQLAVETGLSYTTVSRIERGYPAHKVNVQRICEALGVKLGDVEGINISDRLSVAARRESKRRELA